MAAPCSDGEETISKGTGGIEDQEHGCTKVVDSYDNIPHVVNISCPQQAARDQCFAWRAACGG